jgi:hypothetical protein
MESTDLDGQVDSLAEHLTAISRRNWGGLWNRVKSINQAFKEVRYPTPDSLLDMPHTPCSKFNKRNRISSGTPDRWRVASSVPHSADCLALAGLSFRFVFGQDHHALLIFRHLHINSKMRPVDAAAFAERVGRLQCLYFKKKKLAPRCFVWVILGDQSPRPPGIDRVWLCPGAANWCRQLFSMNL